MNVNFSNGATRTAHDWFSSWQYQQQVQDREYWERQSARAANTKMGRRSWTGFGGTVDQAIASEMGGCFLGESGNRGDAVMASYEYIPAVREEDERIVRNDKLRGRFVSVENLQERDPMDVEVVEEPNGDFSFQAVDPSVGPKFIALKGTVDEALEQVFRKSPKHVLDAYEASGRTGRLDVLVRVPGVVAKLVAEGVLSVQAFQQTPARPGFSCYRILRGYAADERRVIGPEGGIVGQILGLLGQRLQ